MNLIRLNYRIDVNYVAKLKKILVVKNKSSAMSTTDFNND